MSYTGRKFCSRMKSEYFVTSKGKGNPKMINQLLSKTLDSVE